MWETKTRFQNNLSSSTPERWNDWTNVVCYDILSIDSQLIRNKVKQWLANLKFENGGRNDCVYICGWRYKIFQNRTSSSVEHDFYVFACKVTERTVKTLEQASKEHVVSAAMEVNGLLGTIAIILLGLCNVFAKDCATIRERRPRCRCSTWAYR